ncbi:tyrosine-type recombinase/integrase [Methylocystis sp. IM3]|uniref:tyrosine-type recombinase/integrase n=1 Tax=Methylocystis sp. IM3 TaxID=3136722 RepID=UPI00311A762F
MTARKVATAGPGAWLDGDGLYLIVSESLSRTWVYRFSFGGRRPEMGLGCVADGVGLAEARALRDEAKRLRRLGINPIDERRRWQHARAGRLTFGQVADELFATKEPTWRHPGHARQWRASLIEGAAALRPLPADEVDTEAVLRVLKPLWTKTPETASRLRSRIEAVLDAATARGLRTGQNPAAWRGHLAHLLPPPRHRLSRQHYAALPYERVPELVALLRADETITALALEFLLLTAARKAEVLGATFEEFDLEERVWVVPASRMKSAREHRVPLSTRAVEIVFEARGRRLSDYVFPGRSRGRPMSAFTFHELLKRLGLIEATTVHGLRSTFRDWAGNETHFPRELAEVALAHVVGDATERAYRRSDALEKRRALMQAWADYVTQNEKYEPASQP